MRELIGIDVGTRSVKGLVGIFEDRLQILGSSIKEHSSRAMYDGQIHDVPQVSLTLKAVKEDLERRLKSKITEVATAVAGRALLTRKGRAQIDFPLLTVINQSHINSLEWSAVYTARKSLREDDVATWEYICVGYSTVRFFLDGIPIESLLGQRGKSISCEVIATFLPRVVVDGLVSAFELADMKVSLMTLEPIAAMDILIPSDIRKLNIALVDIGAGTSDIAISKDGSVLGYGMVPLAGDEVTEAIMKAFFVDFKTAEEIKRSNSKDITFRNILDQELKLDRSHLLEVIYPVVENISIKISEKIMELNGKPPEVVMCIGGGSLTPSFRETLARILGLSEDRVSIRAGSSLYNLKRKTLKGPEWITPLGILNAYYLKKGFIPIEVWLNGDRVKLLDTGIVTVNDLILSSGFSPWVIYGEPGRGMTIEVNGNLKIFPGKQGSPSQIIVNGAPASLETRIKAGDEVEIIFGERGMDAMVSVEDLLHSIEVPRVMINDKEYELPINVFVDGIPVERNLILYDRAKVEIKTDISLKELFKRTNISLEPIEFHYTLNGIPHSFVWNPVVIMVNGKIFEDDIRLSPGDRIEVKRRTPSVKDVIGPDIGEVYALEVKVNGHPVQIRCGNRITRDGEEVDLESPFLEGDYTVNTSYQPILADVLSVIDIPKEDGTIELKINGKDALFSSPIKLGDDIEINWR
ncbi:MAG: cell division protein FtsA [bacterium]